MADQKITQLPRTTTPTGDDLLVLVNDPGGTAVTQAATISHVLALSSGFPLVSLQPFSITGWTWHNQGSATVTETARSVFFTLPSGSGNNRGLTKALPGGTPTITLAVQAFIPGGQTTTFHLQLRESTTGRTVRYGLSGDQQAFVGSRLNSDTSWANNFANQSLTHSPGLAFFRVQLTATQYTFAFSVDGIHFIDALTENKNAFFASGPDRVGFGGENSLATAYATFVHWSES